MSERRSAATFVRFLFSRKRRVSLQGNHAAQRSKRIMLAVYCPATGIGGHRREERGVGNAEARFFSFHVAARLHLGGLLVGSRQERIASGLRPIGGGHARRKQKRHGPPDSPAVAW